MSRERPAHILQHFDTKKVANRGQHDVAVTMASVSDEMDAILPECAEKSAGLRKLLEARDCFLRAMTEGMK